jgi:hypothetical protein
MLGSCRGVRYRDHLEVLLSLVYRLLRCLIGLPAMLVRPEPSKAHPTGAWAVQQTATSSWNWVMTLSRCGS